MSDERIPTENMGSDSAVAVNLQAHAPVAEQGAPEKLDAIEDIDFLLEEIENKIAPLALA